MTKRTVAVLLCTTTACGGAVGGATDESTTGDDVPQEMSRGGATAGPSALGTCEHPIEISGAGMHEALVTPSSPEMTIGVLYPDNLRTGPAQVFRWTPSEETITRLEIEGSTNFYGWACWSRSCESSGDPMSCVDQVTPGPIVGHVGLNDLVEAPFYIAVLGSSADAEGTVSLAFE